MKVNEWRYATKAGINGLIRHPLLSVAAVTTLALMLFLMSAFMAVSMNANHLSEVAAQQPPIEVSMKVGSTVEEITTVIDFLSNHPYVQELQMSTPEENFNRFKQEMGKDELWEDFDYKRSIPYTFSLRLEDPSYAPTFQEEIEEYHMVNEVLMESHLMSLLDSVRNWTRKVGIIVFSILTVTAGVVVSNTVRIAVLSRGREINVMKYVGSTNAFIRTPFIIEGALIGLGGALVASILASFIYERLVVRLNPGPTASGMSEFVLLPASEVTATLFLLNLAVGILLCVLVSAVSVRKYARV
jgi:cell division transport system permease protein